MIKVATVCTGIGSPEQALKNLNVPHEIVFGCEIDKYARQTYLANFQPNQMFEDMTKQSWERIDIFHKEDKLYSDLFIGGIPCQAFSLAGKRLGELDPRGLLFFDYYRYVKNQQPKVFIIENVKGLLSDNKGKTFQNWLQLLGRSVNTQEMMFKHLDSLEYNLHWNVLNSKDFGVPQNRERVFLVGIRNDLPNDFRFPVGWKLEKRLKDILEIDVDEKYYLSEKMLNYLNTRKDNFNNGKINYKSDEDIASCINASSKSIDISDNIIVEKKGFIKQDTQASQVYGVNGVSPTLTSGTHGYAQGYIQVKEETKQGFAIAEPGDSINLSNPNSETRRGRVGKQIANTLDTACNQAVIEPICVAQRGRYNSDNKINQEFEARKDGVTNTITSVQKDNLIVEPQLTQVAQLEGFESEGRIYDSNGIARTIKNGGGGGAKTGWYEDNSRIRRLTPLECFRLQGFPDSFVKPVSDTQLYKQAGNSITVNVMQAIIKNLIHLL